MSKGVKKPYLHFIGGNSYGVTGSATILKWKTFKILVDCGIIQTNNIVADYKANRDLYKKLKVKEIDAVYITHPLHADHGAGLLIATHLGMNAHIYVPKGCLNLLKITLTDSVKIFQQDSMKLQNKHGIKAPPLADERDIDRVIDRCIELPFNQPIETFGGIKTTLYHAGHIICSAQIVLELPEGYVTKRIGFTGDINTSGNSKSVHKIDPLPFCDVVVGECTYSDPKRSYSIKKDRWYDLELIKTAIGQYNKILFPVFSLQRLEDVLQVLEELKVDLPIYVDTPLGVRIYKAWVEPLEFEETLNLKLIDSWDSSLELQQKDEHCIILASSGMLNAGRALSHLKFLLPNPKNCVMFCGYSADNTLATEIKHGCKAIKLDGEYIDNKAQIYTLNTFSSHANYNQLMDYYTTIRYNKLALVHSEFSNKVAFANTLQNKLISQGKSARVVAVNSEQKIYL